MADPGSDGSGAGGDLELARDLAHSKPGWLCRIFGIESGRLVACDARREGDGWTRTEPFRFLYRSVRGGFFVLRGERQWSAVEPDEGRRFFEDLPVKLCSAGDL